MSGFEDIIAQAWRFKDSVLWALLEAARGGYCCPSLFPWNNLTGAYVIYWCILTLDYVLATDQCIIFLLFLVVASVIAVIVVKVTSSHAFDVKFWVNPYNTVNFQPLESPERKPSLGSSKGGRYFQIFPCKDQFLHWQLIWVHKTDIELTGKCLDSRWFIPRTRAHQHLHQLLAIAYSCRYCTCSKLCGLFSHCEPNDDVNWCTQFFIAQLHHRWACFSCCTHKWRLL